MHFSYGIFHPISNLTDVRVFMLLRLGLVGLNDNETTLAIISKTTMSHFIPLIGNIIFEIY